MIYIWKKKEAVPLVIMLSCLASLLQEREICLVPAAVYTLIQFSLLCILFAYSSIHLVIIYWRLTMCYTTPLRCISLLLSIYINTFYKNHLISMEHSLSQF